MNAGEAARPACYREDGPRPEPKLSRPDSRPPQLTAQPSTAALQRHGLQLHAARASERADRLESLAVAGRARWSDVYQARGEARRLRQMARGAA